MLRVVMACVAIWMTQFASAAEDSEVSIRRAEPFGGGQANRP